MEGPVPGVPGDAVNTRVAKILQSHGVSPDAFAAGEVAGVLTGAVPGTVALALWGALRVAHSETRVWPVIRGEASRTFEGSGEDPAEILGRVPTGASRDLLRERIHEQVEMLAAIVPTLRGGDAASLEDLARRVDQSGVNIIGGKPDRVPDPWPGEPRRSEVELHGTRDILNGELHEAVAFALVADADPFEVPAYLGFGGWNDCPEPELQVAVLREWERTYGAVPVCITGDVLECVVARPPQTEEGAFSLAAEQWIFCDDIVGQGTQSVRRLAMEIWRSPQWFFWWD